MNKWLSFLIFTGLWTSCSSSRPLIDTPTGGSPDYSLESSWGALPSKVDFTDKIPKGMASESSVPDVDIFFLHPTTYTEKKKITYWNGNLADEKLREKTETSTLQFQASIFNKAGNVYALFHW